MLRVRVTLSGTSTGDALSTFYFNNDDSQAAATAAAAAVRAFWQALLGDVLTNATAQVQNEVAVIQPDTGDLSGVWPVSQDVVTFAGGSEPLPRQCQGLISLGTNTFVNGRRVRGHLNVPGPVEAVNAAGVPTSTYRGDLLTAANGLRDNASTNWVVWSRTHGLMAEVTAPLVRTYWANLRTRRD